MQVRLDIEATGAIRKLRQLQSEVRDKAMVASLNATATTVRAEAARAIAADMRRSMRIGVNQARKFLRIERARPGHFTSAVIGEGVLLVPLIKTRVPLPPHAFVQRMRGGHRGIFIRAPTAKRQTLPDVRYRATRLAARGSDLPIAEIFVPGVKATFAQRKIMEAMRRVAAERFAVVVAQQIKRFTK